MDKISNLQPIATQLFTPSGKKISSFEAWRDAVRRTRSRKAIAERFPVENLWPILVRFGAFHEATTSGVEQGLSKLQCNLSPDRCLTWHCLQDVEITCDLPNCEVDWLAEQSRARMVLRLWNHGSWTWWRHLWMQALRRHEGFQFQRGSKPWDTR